MMSYFIKPRKRKYVIRYGFFPFARKLSHKYGNKLLDTGLDTLKTASKKIHIAAEAAAAFIGNKLADKIVKPVEENFFSRKKRRNIIQFKISIKKMEHYKISKLLDRSFISKFLTRKWIEVNDLSSSQYSVNKNLRFKPLY